jgi:hypothetical protein
MTTATIASGGSLSDVVRCPGGKAWAAIQMPASWTAANLTFQVSLNGTTFYDLYDDLGIEVTVTAGATRTIRLVAGDWWAAPWMKIRSGTTGTPVAQGAERLLTLFWQ